MASANETADQVCLLYMLARRAQAGASQGQRPGAGAGLRRAQAPS